MIIKTKKLKYKYDKQVLNSIDLQIKKGSLVSIIGPNGAGKSTLLKSLCGLNRDYEGSISLDGKEIRDYRKKELARKIAYVEQEHQNHFDYSVEEVIEMGFYAKKKSIFESKKKKLKKLMLETETYELRNKSIMELSGGEKQRVFIARALAQESDILLLDEPIANLDMKHQSSLMKMCKKLSTEKNYTIITILHDVNIASIYSDYIAILKDGSLIAYDTSDKLIKEDILEEVYEVEVEVIKHKEHKIILPNL